MISVVDLKDLERRAIQQMARDGGASDEGLAGLKARLRDHVASGGAALVRAVPVRSDAVLMALARGLGEPDAESNGGQVIYDVSPRPDDHHAGDLSTSSAAFPPHTDSTFLVEPHDVICLACVRAASSGGRSVVVRAHALRDRLLAQGAVHVKLLEEPVYPFPVKDPRASQHSVQLVPILEQREDGVHVRWRVDALRLGMGLAATGLRAAHHAALGALSKALEDPALQSTWDLAPGDVLFVDNRRALHGRTAIVGARHVRRLKLFANT